MLPTGSVAIVPAYPLSETALKLSQVIECEATRRAALRGSGVIRVEQNFPMFRRSSSRRRSSVGHNSIRSRRSLTASVAPMPEPTAVELSTPRRSGPLQPLRSFSRSFAPSPRVSVKRVESSFGPATDGSLDRASENGTVVSDVPLTIRGRVWMFFDDPQSSVAAYYCSVSLFFFITLSTIVFIAQTDRSLERHRPILDVIEAVCAGVFSVEYSLRALASPSKWLFFKNLGNWVDLAAILPFYLEAILAVENAGSFGAIRIVRLTRVARVLKMSRYSSAIQVFVQAIAISIKALSMLVFLMAIAVVVFSSAIYFAEFTPDGCRVGGWVGTCDGTSVVSYGYASSIGSAAAAGARLGAGTADALTCVCVDPNPYSSIAESFWWSIVTMSTVGYGDMTPVTIPGRIVGIATILTGMLVLALPITVIGTNFQKVMKSVMQQTMKSNVDYLKGKKQICREEIQAILQRFHAVTTDIHLNIDDIIQVYDTDNSGTLEDDELARFRHDLEMLQNRAMMNQHMDLQVQPTATAVTIAAPLAVPDGRASPGKTMGALMRKLSSRNDIFTRPSPSPPQVTSQVTPEPGPVRQTIAVTEARAASPPTMVRSAHSQPNTIAKPSARIGVTESPRKPLPHPLAVVETDVAAETSTLVLARRASGPSIQELEEPDSRDGSHDVMAIARSDTLTESSESTRNASGRTSSDSLTQHHRQHEYHSPADSHHHHRSSSHSHYQHRSSTSTSSSSSSSSGSITAVENVVLRRLDELERVFEARLVESEARLESKILNLTKMLMRVEKLIELND